MKSTAAPLVSVVIPAYNAESFIEKTLDSVISQTFRNIEILVVDDGSKDRTADIVESIIQRDSRIGLLQQSNQGVAAARNLAIQESKGEFIAPIDADDIWHPQNIEKQVNRMLKTDTSVGLSYAWSVLIDENGWITGDSRVSNIEGYVYPTLLSHYFIANASATLIRRSCLEKIGMFNATFRQQGVQGCEDWELCLRIAKHYEFRIVPEFLIGYRKPKSSMSREYGKMAKSHHFMLESVQKNDTDIPGIIYRLSKVNFYLYFANQSIWTADRQGALYWLRQSVRIDPLLSLLSFRLYGVLKLLIRKHFFQNKGLSGGSHSNGPLGPIELVWNDRCILKRCFVQKPVVLLNALYHRSVLILWKIFTLPHTARRHYADTYPGLPRTGRKKKIR